MTVEIVKAVRARIEAADDDMIIADDLKTLGLRVVAARRPARQV